MDKFKVMSGGYKIQDQGEMYFVTFQVVDWIDLFTRKVYCEEMLDNFRFYRRTQGLRVHAYVIMSNHIHAILKATQPRNDLSSVIGRLKSYSSRCLIKLLKQGPESRGWMLEMFANHAKNHRRNKSYQLWTHDNHPVALDTVEKFRQRLDYIHDNPVKAGIVAEHESYIYSSASNYAGLLSIFKVDLVDEILANLRQ